MYRLEQTLPNFSETAVSEDSNRTVGRIMASGSNKQRRKLKEKASKVFLRLVAWFVITAFFAVVFYIGYQGLEKISLEFLVGNPKNMMTEGGILPCIVGTCLLALGAVAVALPLGVFSAIWLNEYAKDGPLKRLITLSVANLAGVPSIVFGLFGLAFFVILCDLGVSAVSGILTLAVLTLPIIINTVRETLSQIPNAWKEASYALGATKHETILRTVLPAAMPGIMTGAVLAVARAAGETSAIMFTAAVVMTTDAFNSPLSAVMALPHHIYILATTGAEPEKVLPMQSASALVLLFAVFLMNLTAIYFRQKASHLPK